MMQPEKKLYSIVYADPPWDYKDQNCNGAVSYRTTDAAKLSDLRIGEITEKNAVLLMWVTAPFLPEAFDLIKAWGFKYKTCAFTWVKVNKSNHESICGLGRYTRSCCEWVLLATKGKPLPRQSAAVRQILEEDAGEVFRLPREGHSVKPAEFRDRIVELFGDLPRLEMYARKAAEGWDVYGDQAPDSIAIPGDVVKKAPPPKKKTPPPAKKAPPKRNT